ncbi:FtsQ-type POTRA domain-containing protein [Clostridium sp. DSM 100503]|uniref:cell division protein FtsQ/DivIB n=1 Tax=Clostridium sp. DSM 100503 TaxID=2963282 RepID=UPI00214A2331|nr:FtsQ-type POTRA domain-containing protein [Clostridium sp. DSM 100503]MCR1949718.1 FtsQ-type POTRA domain-containing protein [Clostridium sp. DSM 100503]
MNNKSNKFIRRKKRNKIIKRLILGLFVIIVGIIIFIYKSPIFNLKKIDITGLVTLSNESLQENLKYYIGQNIFTIDYNEIEKELKENPYIKEIKVNKKGINSLNINIKENKIAYYFESDGKIKAINNEGVIVEELDKMNDRNLIKLTGIDLSGKTVGDKISDNINILDTLEKFYNIIEVMPQEYIFSQIEIENLNNIVCYIGNIEIMIGDSSDLTDKMNLALNAIEQGVISKGYIDMSFNGPAVIKQIN